MITRLCTLCHQSFPATEEYFHKSKSGRHGLNSVCRECRKAVNRTWKKSYAESKIAVAEAALEADEHAGLIVEEETAPGCRIIHFGKKWKPQHKSISIEHMSGYSSPLEKV